MNDEPMGQQPQQQQVSFEDDGAAAARHPQDGLVTPHPPRNGTSNNSHRPCIKSLSVVSKQYDRHSKGYLDATEQAMRDLDESGRGHVPNAVVYDLMQESVDLHRKMATQRWILVALAAFTVILALANLATAFAAASLAKDTEVSAATGDLNVKGSGDSPQRVGTTAKSELFALGRAAETPANRRRRLQTFEVTGEFEYAGHTNLDAVEAQALYAAHQNDSDVKLMWTCGTFGQGREFVKAVRGGSRTAYLGNETEGTANGTLYVYDVDADFGPFFQPLPTVPPRPAVPANATTPGVAALESGGSGDGMGEGEAMPGSPWSSSAQLSGLTLPAVPQYQQIMVDCQDGAPVCTVANTNCCAETLDEETMRFVDDCPGDNHCAACGCMCIPPGTPEFRCYSGCDLAEPFAEEPILGGL